MADQESPQASEPMTRRGFVGWAIGLASAFAALVVGVPVIGSLVGAGPPSKRGGFVRVSDVSALPVGVPTALTFVEETQDAYNYSVLPHSVWAVRGLASSGGEGEATKGSPDAVTVFSPVCPHLGCQVFWDGSTGRFSCPCHGSVFSEEGEVLGGPAPRGLDVLPSQVRNGGLYVKWVDYVPAISRKIPV
jgi:menaquinol-cytochrome c reductase iron-sulfur subunit